MYKIQMAFQKIVCYLALVAGVVSFVYSLGLVTDLYDSLYTTMRNPKNLTKTTVPGSIIFYDMQDFNKLLLYLSIGLILLGALLFLTQTHHRRKYYVGNIVATGLYAAVAVGVSVWMHGQIAAFKTQFLTTLDFEALAKHAKVWKSLYTESTFWFDVHWLVLALLVGAAVLLCGNLVWKFMLMRAEERLLKNGKEVAAA